MSKTKSAGWDRHAIRAEIHRRGSNLTRLALDNDLEPSACRVALARGHPAAERVIADFLGVKLRELWPTRYPLFSTASQPQPTPVDGLGASPKRGAA